MPTRNERNRWQNACKANTRHHTNRGNTPLTVSATSLPKPSPRAHLCRTLSEPPWRGTQPFICNSPRTSRGPFPKPMPTVRPMVNFGPPKPAGHGTLHNAASDLMHHQYRLSVLQWSPQEPYADACGSLWAFPRGHPLRSQRLCSWSL